MRRFPSIIAAVIYLSLSTCCRAEACPSCTHGIIVWHIPFVFSWLLVCAVWLVGGFVFRAIGRFSGQRVKIQYAQSWLLLISATVFTLLAPALSAAILIGNMLTWMYRTHVSIKSLESRSPVQNAFLHFQRLTVLALAATAVYSVVQAKNDAGRAIFAFRTPGIRSAAQEQLLRIGLDALPGLTEQIQESSEDWYLLDDLMECTLQIIQNSPANEERETKIRCLGAILGKRLDCEYPPANLTVSAAQALLELDKPTVAALLPVRIAELARDHPSWVCDRKSGAYALTALAECVVRTGDSKAIAHVERCLAGILRKPLAPERAAADSERYAAAAEAMLEIDKTKVAALLPARIEELVSAYERVDDDYPTDSLALLVECMVKTGDHTALARVLTDTTMNILIEGTPWSSRATKLMEILGCPYWACDHAQYRHWWHEAKRNYLPAPRNTQPVRIRTTSQTL